MHVVLLNGVGSAGKTSVAKALQKITSAPFLHVQMDAFLDMMPEPYLDHPEGLMFETGLQDGKPVISIQRGPVAERTFLGMRRAIAAMAQAGNNLIVDDVMLGNEATEYAALLCDVTLHMVGVSAPLDVLEARERARGDRLIGLARWQYDRVHQGKHYDLTVDTSKAAPAECALLIRDAFGL
ncbi:MAG: chloramphenicol phosphotransferase [Chloroflexi bacterium]|nr:chloramphenicol phosphotransferase [Chloroflexota bacterium]